MVDYIFERDQQRLPKVALRWTPPGIRKPGIQKQHGEEW